MRQGDTWQPGLLIAWDRQPDGWWGTVAAFADYLDQVDTADDDAAARFVAWARDHLDATDPRKGFPDQEAPQWSHAARLEHGRPEPKPRYGWMT